MNVKIFSGELLNSLVQKALQSTRTRQHLNIHQSYEDPCQRFFNAIGLNSYIRPHRHSLDPKTEDLISIRGLFALVQFNETGEIDNIIKFGSEKYAEDESVGVGVELAPGTWHTVLALTDGAILLELKAGPFSQEAAKEPAPWAPQEGTPSAVSYLESLHRAVVSGDR